MGVTVLPNPALLFDFYAAGPWLRNDGVSTTFSDYLISNLTQFVPETRVSATPRPIWEHSQGGTGVTSVAGLYRGVLSMQGSSTDVSLINGMGGVDFLPITDISNLAAGYRQPSWRRVQWLTMNLAMDFGTLDRNSGVLLVSGSGPQSGPIWPVAAATIWTGGWGIVGDGAGNWNWESFGHNAGFTVPGPLTESVSLAPAISDAADWHTFDFVCISGAGGREASFELHIDSEVFLTRNWVDAPVLDTLPVAPPDLSLARRWFPVWQVSGPNNEKIYFGDWEFRMGRFLPDGRELLV